MARIMDKYYTPDIEEFHIGFEYEYEDINEGGSSLSWYKGVIKENECYLIDNLITNEEHGLSYRVKYLDKEDIESLGFTITEEETKPYGHYLQGYIKHENRKTELWYSSLKDKEHIYVTLKNSHFNGNAKFYIKNKSELRKLLKQLNIL